MNKKLIDFVMQHVLFTNSLHKNDFISREYGFSDEKYLMNLYTDAYILYNLDNINYYFIKINKRRYKNGEDLTFKGTTTQIPIEDVFKENPDGSFDIDCPKDCPNMFIVGNNLDNYSNDVLKAYKRVNMPININKINGNYSEEFIDFSKLKESEWVNLPKEVNGAATLSVRIDELSVITILEDYDSLPKQNHPKKIKYLGRCIEQPLGASNSVYDENHMKPSLFLEKIFSGTTNGIEDYHTKLLHNMPKGITEINNLYVNSYNVPTVNLSDITVNNYIFKSINWENKLFPFKKINKIKIKLNRWILPLYETLFKQINDGLYDNRDIYIIGSVFPMITLDETNEVSDFKDSAPIGELFKIYIKCKYEVKKFLTTLDEHNIKYEITSKTISPYLTTIDRLRKNNKLMELYRKISIKFKDNYEVVNKIIKLQGK